jgi:2-iminobutanoate/2-iminopropanoate deaminase
MTVDEHMTRILAPDAPPAIGPYSQAIVANGFVFCTGQVAIDPVTDQIVEGDIKVQTRQVLQNLDAVLRAAGSGLSYVVKTTVYLANFHDFAAMNEVYEEFFSAHPPARSTAGVSLPRNLLVQIDCTAIVPSASASMSFVEARDSTSTYDLDGDLEF